MQFLNEITSKAQQRLIRTVRMISSQNVHESSCCESVMNITAPRGSRYIENLWRTLFRS